MRPILMHLMNTTFLSGGTPILTDTSGFDGSTWDATTSTYILNLDQLIVTTDSTGSVAGEFHLEGGADYPNGGQEHNVYIDARVAGGGGAWTQLRSWQAFAEGWTDEPLPGELQWNETSAFFNIGFSVGGMTPNTNYEFRFRWQQNGTGGIWHTSTPAFTIRQPRQSNSITFVGKGAFTSGTSSISVPYPTGIASGDVCFLIVETQQQSITTPSGWTLVMTNYTSGSGGASGHTRIAVFSRAMTSQLTSQSVADAGLMTNGIILAYRGLDTVTPVKNFSFYSDNTLSTAGSFSVPSTSDNYAFCLMAIGLGGPDAASTAQGSNYAHSELTSITERHDQTTTNANGGGMLIFDGIRTVGGSEVSGGTFTKASAVRHAGLSIELMPL